MTGKSASCIKIDDIPERLLFEVTAKKIDKPVRAGPRQATDSRDLLRSKSWMLTVGSRNPDERRAAD